MSPVITGPSQGSSGIVDLRLYQELIEEIERLEKLIIIGKPFEVFKERKTNEKLTPSTTGTTLVIVTVRDVEKASGMSLFINGEQQANIVFPKEAGGENQIPTTFLVPANQTWELFLTGGEAPTQISSTYVPIGGIGSQGEIGPKGEKGETGPKGEAGAAITLKELEEKFLTLSALVQTVLGEKKFTKLVVNESLTVKGVLEYGIKTLSNIARPNAKTLNLTGTGVIANLITGVGFEEATEIQGLSVRGAEPAQGIIYILRNSNAIGKGAITLVNNSAEAGIPANELLQLSAGNIVLEPGHSVTLFANGASGWNDIALR